MRGCRVMAMVCLVGIGLGAGVGRAEAQTTRTWVGPDGGNWSDPNNWSPAGPLAATEDLEFDASAPATSHNDLVGLHIIRLFFNGTHTVSGNEVSLFGLAVAGAAVAATVNLPLRLRGDQNWFVGFPSLGVSAPIDLNGFQLTIDSQSTANIGAVTGAGGIVKAGNGVVQLLAASDFTGQVEVQDGTLRIAHLQALGTADGTMANGTVVRAGATLRIESVLALDEPLQVSGLGHNDTGAIRIVPVTDAFEFTAPVELTNPDDTSLIAITGGPPPVVTFSQPLTGTGLLILDDTTVVLAATGNAFTRAGFAASSFSTSANGTLRIGVDHALPPETTVDIPATATFDLAGHSAAVGEVTGLGTVTLGSGGTLTVVVVPPGVTFTQFDGTISGTGTLYKQGAGSLTLTGASTFAGPVYVNTGELWVLHPNALGVADGTPANGTVVTTGATLAVGVASLANEALTIAGAGHSFGALQIGAFGPVSIAGPITLASSALIGISSGAHLTLAGGVGGSGQLRLAGTAGEVWLTGQGSPFIGGSIFVDSIILHVGADGVLHSSASILNEGLIQLEGHALEVQSLNGNGNVSLGGGALRVGYGGSYGGPITGAGTLTKLGDGTFTLTGETMFSGPVTISRGTLTLAHAQALASPITVLDGGSLHFSTTTTYNSPLSLDGVGPGTGGALRVSNGAQATLTGTTTMTADARIEIAAASELRLQGQVTAPVLRFRGPGAPGGTLSLGGSGHTIGDVEFSGATLQLNAPQVLPASIALAVPTGSAFNVNGFAQTLAGLSGVGTVAIGGGSLMLSAPDFSQVFGGALEGTGTLLLDGTGLALTGGTHTFSGTIFAIGGSLSHRGTLPAKIQGGGTQVASGPGSIVGAITLTNSILTLGDAGARGAVTTPGLTLSGTASRFTPFIHDPAQGPPATITVNGAVSLSGALSPAFANFTPAANVPIILIDNDGVDPISGEFGTLPEGTEFTVGGIWMSISYVGGTGNDLTLTRLQDDTSPPVTYHLAEGATGSFFDTDLLIANPQNAAVTATVVFMKEGGGLVTRTYTLEPMTRLTIAVDEVSLLENAVFSTEITSDSGPLVVERTMRWDTSGYGAHTDKATQGATHNWYFAEGSEGFFRTFLLIANPTLDTNVAEVQFLRENEPPFTLTFTLAPTSRQTIASLDHPELVGRSFGMRVMFQRPGIAERAMYFGTDPVWTGGHASAGVTLPWPTWFLAEGATGEFFDTFILVANPGTEPADVTLTFLPEQGEPATLTRTVPGLTRLTVNVEDVVASEGLTLPLGPVATQVSATQPVVAERAQYWPFSADRWHEAHNSFGVTDAALKWGLAEGRAGGNAGYQTFVLLANPGMTPATVTLRFLGDGVSTVPAEQTVTVPAQRRLTVPVEAAAGTPAEMVTTFGTVITSDQPIVVERALYWNVGGQIWAAGTNATASRLP